MQAEPQQLAPPLPNSCAPVHLVDALQKATTTAHRRTWQISNYSLSFKEPAKHLHHVLPRTCSVNQTTISTQRRGGGRWMARQQS